MVIIVIEERLEFIESLKRAVERWSNDLSIEFVFGIIVVTMFLMNLFFLWLPAFGVY